MSDRGEHWSRRQFVSGLTLAGTAGLLGVPAQVAAEPPPETARIRVASVPSVCLSPQYVAEEFLRVEGFTDVRYLPTEAGVPGAQQMGKGENLPRKSRHFWLTLGGVEWADRSGRGYRRGPKHRNRPLELLLSKHRRFRIRGHGLRRSSAA